MERINTTWTWQEYEEGGKLSITNMVFENYQVTIIPGKIFYGRDTGGGFRAFEIRVEPNQVEPETKRAGPTVFVFYVLPVNGDTCSI